MPDDIEIQLRAGKSALKHKRYDAAIAAWGSKGHYDYVRPITKIRYQGSLGQSSDPNLPRR